MHFNPLDIYHTVSLIADVPIATVILRTLINDMLRSFWYMEEMVLLVNYS